MRPRGLLAKKDRNKRPPIRNFRKATVCLCLLNFAYDTKVPELCRSVHVTTNGLRQARVCVKMSLRSCMTPGRLPARQRSFLGLGSGPALLKARSCSRRAAATTRAFDYPIFTCTADSRAVPLILVPKSLQGINAFIRNTLHFFLISELTLTRWPIAAALNIPAAVARGGVPLAYVYVHGTNLYLRSTSAACA